MSLASDIQPPGSRPPRDWANAPGRKGIEKIVIKSHLTMYALVSLYQVVVGKALGFNRYWYPQDGLWVRLQEADDTETV